MADKKLSEMSSATEAVATDLMMIVHNGVNQKITAGAFASGLPNIGNRGVHKNLPTLVTTEAIPLTGTLYTLTLALHTLADGVPGQEVTLIGSGSNTVTLAGAGTLTSINFPTTGATCTLAFVGAAWYVKSHFSVTFG